MRIELKRISLAALMVAAIAAAPAAAKSIKPGDPVTSNGGCAVSDVMGIMAGNADDCWGAANENVNDKEDILNLSTFDGTLGLFGETTWEFLTKLDKDPDSTSGTDIGLTVDLTPSKVWSVDADALDGFSKIAIILKQSNTFAAYLFNDNPGDSGTWDTTAAAFGKNAGGISHFSIYTIGGSTPPPPVIPLPASSFLLIAGLGGLAALRRGKR